ncbi:MAG: GNAT family N-acetyltransferase [Burkholderiales bacterium]
MADSRIRDLVLALAHPDDAPVIAVMSRELIETGLGWSWTPARVAKSIGHAETVVLTARNRTALAGFAIMIFGLETAHLSLLAVSAEHQRQGVGGRLFEWLRKSALTAGIVQVKVEMRAHNTVARKFYESLGFTQSGVVPGYYCKSEDALRMAMDPRCKGGER